MAVQHRRESTSPDAGPTPPPGEKQRRNALGEVFPEERVTLDFRQTSVRRVLRLFREKADLQIVLAPEVRGRVTVHVEDLPIREAFRTVLRAADLVCHRRGETLVVRPRDRVGVPGSEVQR